MTSFLSAHGLAKQFGDSRVLDGVDFQLNKGECLVLLGPSGCGKTTLLNIVAGLIQADGGELLCDGQTLEAPERGVSMPMGERRFAMVFQDFSLWPHMTVAQNVAFGLKLKSHSRTEVERLTRRALERVQMSHLAERKPSELSGGQQQRVSIARAIAVDPRVLLLDEPLSALDARLREELKAELSGLLKDTGLTSIYVTHDQSEAFSLGDQIALMNEGRIEQLGAPEDMYRRPLTRFAATFIGSANVIPYQRRSGDFLLGEHLTLSNRDGALNHFPDTGHLVIRREAVKVVAAQTAPCQTDLNLEGICTQRHFLGERQEVTAEIHPGLTLRGFADQTFAPGTPVSLRINTDALHAVGR
ncbi:ABC transporter ATP-binding protein [Marinimicrobium alkaliphilum]|uniref:ABC transporter ATP-binding protein n=1 Tax=Marinimicrobium alkaliphilum TaxID=2202654 RepID=UPI0018E07D27|nr:ABC transporter ATP-binding protein [Marinimicrobium alkaliphilum]